MRQTSFDTRCRRFAIERSNVYCLYHFSKIQASYGPFGKGSVELSYWGAFEAILIRLMHFWTWISWGQIHIDIEFVIDRDNERVENIFNKVNSRHNCLTSYSQIDIIISVRSLLTKMAMSIDDMMAKGLGCRKFWLSSLD